jgi:pimeloyl-ACP methyl ester carboxylesterase
MGEIRLYGSEPYSVAVIHGGPGAPGEMAPVAMELSRDRGIAEPMQSADSVSGQIDELKAQLEEKCLLPITLVGHSWGAFLSLLLAAKYPDKVEKVILIGSPAFSDQYAEQVMANRLAKLKGEQREKMGRLMKTLETGPLNDREEAFRGLAAMFTKTDAFNAVDEEYDVPPGQYRIYMMVWGEARDMRSSGELLEIAKDVRCPVVAIHGDKDPHPADGVKGPLSAVIKNFRFMTINNCGHEPWLERSARDQFFRILREELA